MRFQYEAQKFQPLGGYVLATWCGDFKAKTANEAQYKAYRKAVKALKPRPGEAILVIKVTK